jgi:hypothetical protein
MQTRVIVAIVGVALALAASLAAIPVWAHHAFSAEFDINRPLTLEGTVVVWEMINPHSWFHIDVEGPDGEVVRWEVEGGSPNQLIRNGVTINSVPIGTVLVVEGYGSKDRTNKAVGSNFVLSDGSRLFLGGSAANVAPPVSVRDWFGG